MSERQNKIRVFLAGTDWRAARPRAMAGDASSRRYFRVTRGDGRSAVLMDAPPDYCDDIRPFVEMAGHLSRLGLSAPEIYQTDPKSGFILLEDFGKRVFAKEVRASREVEQSLYFAAIDVLVLLGNSPSPFKEAVGAQTLSQMVGPAEEFFFGVEKGAFFSEIEPFLSKLPPVFSLALRDFHAENLMWLPDRSGLQKVGLLDFQDAISTYRVYDLVSLVQDARRDLGHGIAKACIDRFLDSTGIDRDQFSYEYSVIGAQRNLRILGIFARLAKQADKPQYLKMIPRVWDHLQTDLSHPDLAPLRKLINEYAPNSPDHFGVDEVLR